MSWRGLFDPLLARLYLGEIKWHREKFCVESSLRPSGVGDDLKILTRDIAELCKFGPQSGLVSSYKSLYQTLSALNEILDLWVSANVANEELTARLHDATSDAEDEVLSLLQKVKHPSDSRLVKA